MGKSLEFGIKKKRAAQAALAEEILLHLEHGAVRALSLELVTTLSDEKETRVRAQILNNGASALLSLNDLKLLSKSQWKSIKGKSGIEASVALRDHIAAGAIAGRFCDMSLLEPFTIDDSGAEYIKVGNTSAIMVPITRGTPGSALSVRLPDAYRDIEHTKVRFAKSQRVTRIST
jgi:hypothetical protein